MEKPEPEGGEETVELSSAQDSSPALRASPSLDTVKSPREETKPARNEGRPAPLKAPLRQPRTGDGQLIGPLRQQNLTQYLTLRRSSCWLVPHPLWNKDVDVWPRPAGYCPRVDTHGHAHGNGARHRYSPTLLARADEVTE